MWFADDTKLYIGGETVKYIIQNINSDLKKCIWLFVQ